MSIYYKELTKLPTTKAYYKAWDYLQKAVQMLNRADLKSSDAEIEVAKLSKLIKATASFLEPVMSNETATDLYATWETPGEGQVAVSIKEPRLDVKLHPIDETLEDY